MSEIDEALQKKGISTAAYNKPWKELNGPERWLTKDEAIDLLNIWRRDYILHHNLYYVAVSKIRNYGYSSGFMHAYKECMIDILIDRIRKSDHDPITTVAEFNYEMDDVLAVSDNDHRLTHRFAGFMERSSYEVLLYLKDKEKELNQNGSQTMVR